MSAWRGRLTAEAGTPVGSARLLPLLAGLLLVVVHVTPAGARRLPSPGGEMSLALPTELRGAVVAANTGLPFVEPVPPGTPLSRRLAWPPLPGLQYRSRVLLGIEAQEDGRRWVLDPRVSAPAVRDALAECFAYGSASWPGDVLHAAGVAASVRLAGGHVLLELDAAVGPVPELLAGCVLPAASGAPFVLAGDRLVARPDAVEGAPLLDAVVLRGPATTADLAAGGPRGLAGDTLLSQAPDVLLIVQSEEARLADPFGLAHGSDLRRLLDPELMLAVFWEGRGAPAGGLLPPGIAPSRPLPAAPPDQPGPELRIEPLPDGAPMLDISFAPADPLLAGVVERLAVILRSRGWGMGGAQAGAEVLRWRPPTLDPALALLALAGARTALLAAAPAESGLLADVPTGLPRTGGESGQSDPLANPDLLSSDPARRLEAALLVERAWIDQRRVVPLMTADLWVVVDPDLRGVTLRPDGVPLLEDAWWAVPR